MKSIFRKSLFGFVALLAFVWISTPNTASALVVCSGMPAPLMSIVINGTTYANSANTPSAHYSISVPSGTTLPVTFSNPSPGATPYNISRSYPNGHTLTYTTNPGTQSYTTDPITSNTNFAVGVDRDCFEDPTTEGGGDVTVSVTVTAAPPPPTTYALSVSKAGAGTGTVTSSPAGINCGADCSESYTSGTSVTLSQASASGSTFGGWSGACSGTGSCVVSMTQARSVTATFNSTAVPLPSCSANPAVVVLDQSTVIAASGGSGGVSPYYTWNTGSGGGACATGGTCTTSYSTEGIKTVTVTRNGVSGTCSVDVRANPNPPTAAFTGSSACTVNGWGDDIDTSVARPIRIYYKIGAGSPTLGPTVTAGASGCVGSACTFSANLSSYLTPGTAYTITGEVQGSGNEWVGFTNSQTSLSLTCPVTGVECSGPTAGQTGQSYTFNATGGAAHTWSASSAEGTMTPSGTTGSGSSVSKSFSQAGTKTITFARTDTGATDSCTIDITTTPPSLSFALFASPTLINYGQTATLSWSSTGAERVDNDGSTPTDEAWVATSPIAEAGSVTVSPLVRTTYNGRAVNSNPLPVSQSTGSAIVQVRPECLPAGQPGTVGQPVSLTARGGNGTYAWTSTGATPTSGTASPYSVTYDAAGTYSVGLTSDGLTATACTVTVSDAPVVTGTVVVNSNIPTTWTLTGPGGVVNEQVDQTTETYSSMAISGTPYTVTNVPDIAGYDAPTITPSSQSLTAGGTITFTINYDEEGGGAGDGVDLKINDSNNPAPVANGATVALSWTSNNINADSCVASEGVAPWSGARDDSGSETSGVLADTTTFTITCESSGKGGGEVSDSVAIIVVDPQCNNDNDDDNDKFTDWNGENNIDGDEDDDPDCDNAQDNNEQGDDDDTGGDVTECSDGFDNDGDGGIDYNTSRGGNGDIHCSSLLDDDERGSPDIREI